MFNNSFLFILRSIAQFLVISGDSLRDVPRLVLFLISAVESWHPALYNRSDVCSVFLDLSKAFDKVPHSLLMDKLSAWDINLYLLKWLWTYLSNRSQYVVVNGESSQSAHVIFGVPQGSVLGPLLFLIYVDDVADIALPNGSLMQMTSFSITRSTHNTTITRPAQQGRPGGPWPTQHICNTRMIANKITFARRVHT